jgi:photosystem II stability/assembly factor-like uncharacterized protein
LQRDAQSEPISLGHDMNMQDGFQPSRRTLALGLATALGVEGTTPQGALADAPSGDATAMAFDGGALILATDAGLWRSGDDGAEWSALPSEPGSEVAALATHPDRPGRILAALEAGGVALSEDGGASWAQLGSGLPEAAATALAIPKQEPDTLYLAVSGDGLWQSPDAGATWSYAMDRPWLDEAERDLLALASVDSSSGMGGIWVYAGTDMGLTRVPDCFCRWQDVQPGDAMDALAAGEQPAAVMALPPGEAVLDLALAPQVPEVIHAATASGLWRSTDVGVNWTRTSDIPAQALAVDPADPDHIVAATAIGILLSRDGGLTWAAPSP